MKRLLSLVSLVALLTLAGCGSMVQARRDFSFTHPWNDFTRIEVRTVNGEVELQPGDNPDVKIAGTLRAGGATLDEANRNVEQVMVSTAMPANRAGTLVIEIAFPEALRNRGVGADIHVQLPKPCAASVSTSNGHIDVERLQGEAVLDTSNGTIEATDVTGLVTASTSNGDVEVKGVQGEVRADTSNGSIHLTDVTGTCKAKTSNGAIYLSGVHGNIHADTSNADIVAAIQPPADGRVELDTSNGGIRLTLPKDLAATLRLSTSNGRVRTNLDEALLKVDQRSHTHLQATYNGGGCTVVADTSNGSITVDAR